jgi:hypothetical protein
MFKPRKTTARSPEPSPATSGPPQLVIVRDDEASALDEAASEEDSADGSAGAGDSGIASGPHTGRTRAPRSLRRDASHRRRG